MRERERVQEQTFGPKHAKEPEECKGQGPQMCPGFQEGPGFEEGQEDQESRKARKTRER